jgi:copper homeostasis protein (lipoprotein)
MKKPSLVIVFFIMVIFLFSCKESNNQTASSELENNQTSSSESASVVDMHNSANSLNWEGKYKGIVPCADCEGIKTELSIFQNQSYSMAIQYLGKSDETFKYKGEFTWNEDGNTITLGGLEFAASKYLVGEDVLIQLDMQGNRILGEMANQYFLRKSEQANTPQNWRLIELYSNSVGNNEIFFTYNVNENTISGFGGCNNFTGKYELKDDGKVTISPLAATKKACLDKQISALENDFFKMFEKVESFESNNVSLSLIDNTGKVIAYFTSK